MTFRVNDNMLVVLKGADFSGDYIEKIDIGGLEAAVVNMLSNLTKYPPSSQNAYAQALNTLYKGLVSDGLWSKLKLLCIPLMADTVSEVLYDCATGVAENANALRTYFGLNAKGELYNTTVVPVSTTLGFQRTINPNDLTLFGCCSKSSGNQAITLISVSKHQYTFSAVSGANFITSGNSVLGQVTLAGVPVTWNGGAMVQRAFPGGAFVLSSKAGTVTYKDSTGSVQSTTSANETETHILPLIVESGASGSVVPGSCGLFGAASGLTANEIAKLYDHISQFYSAFN